MMPHSMYLNTIRLIMIKDDKKLFDEALATLLQNDIYSTQKLKASKKLLKFTSENFSRTVASIGFDYLSGQKAYYFAIVCSSGEFSDYISKINPPYISNNPPDFGYDFSMSSLMENRGIFSRTDGKIYLTEVQDINKTIMHIGHCLNEYYIPKVENFLTFRPPLIKDIVENPNFYSYPAPLIAFVMQKNSIKPEDLKFSFGKKIIKNSTFDKSILGIKF